MDVASEFRRALERHKAGDLPGAEAGYRAVLARAEEPDALGNLSLLLARRGELAEAEALQRRAVALAPDQPGHRYNLGRLLRSIGRFDEAGDQLTETLRLQPGFPDAALNLANTRLAQGRFEEGWRLYDQRPQRLAAEARKLAFPEWQGEPLAGKRLFVWVEQGFGDQILAARFLPLLEAAEVTVVCHPALARLFAPLADRIVVRQPQTPVGPEHDFWTLPLSLPRWLGARPETLPVAPYLRGEARGAGGVGLVWRGNAEPDPHRSMSEAAAAELLALPGVVSLHPEDTGARDFQDTADLMAGLDRVVSIDTGAAHLAGALGRPCWVLLHHFGGADWRWAPAPGRDSLWYPSVETLTQPTPGDWSSVVAEVRRRLGL